MSQVTRPEWQERYMRAAALHAVYTAPMIENAALEGYWIDTEHFFFLKQRYDADVRASVDTPWLLNARQSEAVPILELNALAAVLERAEGRARDPATLKRAAYEMRTPAHLIVRLPDQWFEINWAQQRVTRQGALDPTPKIYAPNSALACVVDGYNLALLDSVSATKRPLTEVGVSGFAYGRLPENNLSPIAYARSPSPVALWSADSKWVLTHLVDERTAPETALVQHAPPGGGRPIVHPFKLSTPQDPVPLSALAAIEVETGKQVLSEFHPLQLMSPLMAGAAWFGEGIDSCYYVVGDRFRRHVRLIRLDLGSGAEKTIFEESAVEGYVETHPLMFHPPNVRVLERTKEVIWYSDRDGWGHLYLVNLETGAITRQITKGAWMVRDIVHVDENARILLFTASGFDLSKDLGRRRLCEVSLDTGEIRVLIAHEGDVVVAPAPTRPEGQGQLFRPDMLRKGASDDGRFVVARRTHVTDGSATLVLDRQTGTETVLCEASSAISAPASTPTELSLVAADGITPIHGVLILPRNAVRGPEGTGIPLVDLMYPGPQAPWVPRGYGVSQVLAAQSLAELGFGVLLLDTRGIPHRARAIRQAGYGSDLEPQLADHAAAIAQVCAAYHELDPRRVAAVGVSAGGAGAARALFDYPSTYCCAAAIAGSHEVRIYRSGWADFYLGPKSEEPSNIDLAHKLEGALMLVSGDMDDNVPISQTLRLVDALIRANKDFDLLIAPNEGHLTFMTNGYVHRRVWDFLVRQLWGAEPPRAFSLSHLPEALAAYGRVLSRGAPE